MRCHRADGIPRDVGVRGDQREPLHLRLRHQHPVEWVGVMPSAGSPACSACTKVDRKLAESRSLNRCGQMIWSPLAFPSARLMEISQMQTALT